MFVITGGGTGIGKALALALAAREQSVLIVGRRELLLSDIAKTSQYIDYVVADVSTQQGRQTVVEHLSGVASLKGLIHNAGCIAPIKPLGHIDEQAWQALMATNVDAPLFLSQQLLHKLSHGRVLHIGSGAAHFPVVGWSAYCVSKAALLMLTKCWQLECCEPAFASVMPGIVDTDMVAAIRQATDMDPQKLDFFKRLKDSNQLIPTETVAAFLCWLLLDIHTDRYVSNEWDIYDTSHHADWLPSTHRVPTLDES